MNYRNAFVILLLVSFAAWWLLHEGSEAKIRRAHEELNVLLNKEEGQPSSASILNAGALRVMFADTSTVTGDAAAFEGSYTPEEMVGTIIQVQALFQSIELTFGELEIEFSTVDDATVHFTAVLVGHRAMDTQVERTREVASQMRRVDGDWLFAEFNLTTVPLRP